MGSTTARSAFVGDAGANYRFTVLDDGLLRYEWAPDGVFEDRPSSFAVNRQPAVVPDYQVRESVDRLEIITSRFHLTYNKQQFTPFGLFALVFEHTRSRWRYGEHKPWENLGGTARTLDGVDGRIDMGTGIMSEKGYAAIDDSQSMLFEGDGVASRRPGAGRVDGYLFAYGHDYRAAIKAFYLISGATPLLPRWALGNWWSRNYAYSAESYLALMDKFAEIEVPLSVGVIDMDWHLVDDPRVIAAKQTGWTGYTWNRSLFPDPPAFLAQLHRRKLKVALNDHPSEGIHSFEDMYGAVARALNHDTTDNKPIEFDVTSPKFMRAYFDVLLASLEEDGCDFWWIDWQQGPYSLMKGIDPLWMLNHFHFLHIAKRYPHSYPLIFSRYAGPGSHRYPVGFSGDTIVSWKSLQFQPEFTATASNIGYGWWSHDIGGHMDGIKDEELTLRWIQLGVFSPIMRLHSTKSRWVAKEPWKLQNADIVSHFLRLRHRLIPYLHTMNARMAIDGLPLVQPMYWEWPERAEAYRYRNQYLFGDQMLVVPITSPQNTAVGLAKAKCWLPPGEWVDFFTGSPYKGDCEMWISRPKDSYPVFLRKGSIVPLDGNQKPKNGSSNPVFIELVLVVGADGKFELLEQPQAEQSAKPVTEIDWIQTKISYTQATGTVKIEASPRSGPRIWSLLLLGVFEPGQLQPFLDQTALTSSEATNGRLVYLGNLGPGTTVVQLGKHLRCNDSNGQAHIERIIDNASVDYALKDQLWELFEQPDMSNAGIMNAMEAIDMDGDLRIAISEYLTDY